MRCCPSSKREQAIAFGTITGVAIEGSGAVLVGRIRNLLGSLVTQASLSSIAYAVHDLDLDEGEQEIGTGTLTVSAVVFDSLQVDDLWESAFQGKDEDGYNFRWVVPASLLTNGGDRYRVSVKFTPTSGEVFQQPFEFTLLESDA